MRFCIKVLFLGFVLAMMSCSTTKKLPSSVFSLDQAIDTSKVLSTGFSGVHITDLKTEEVVFSKNASKYFVPASNTKIFTLWASLNYLGDSIPALKYVETDTSLTFWGTGDPTFMHSLFPATPTLEFLKSKAKSKKLFQSYGHSTIKHFGEGWMWDDFNDYYQPEISTFPAYGNVLTIKKDSMGIAANPEYLMNNTIMTPQTKIVKRNPEFNQFLLPALLDTIKAYYQEIPYKDAENVNRQILESLIGTKINPINLPIPDDAKTVYSSPTDTVLRRMMQVSDNMLAEQLLLLTGLAQNDTLSAVFSISHAKTNLLRDLIDSPIWVDGSGLSKYNMMTPRSITQLLKKMHQQTNEQRLFSLMAIGGQNGSLRNMFKSTDGPYIFAKTGSLAAVYNLSGYMITRSGRKLIFSFMNNNFSGSATPVRKEVERVLNLVREHY